MLRPMLAAVLLGVIALPAGGQAGWPPAVGEYQRELQAVEQARAPDSLEALFAAGEEVQGAVMQLKENQAWMETLTDSEYSALKTALRGMVLSRGYDIYAQPDPAFLLALAQTHGRPQDLTFFRLYQQYWSADYMPVFQRQGNSPTPCVRFGERIIPEVYEAWLGYAKNFPLAYSGFVQQTLKDVEELVSLGTCACGDEKSVVQELRGFLKRFPASPASAPIRARLRQLHDNPEKLPIRCR